MKKALYISIIIFLYPFWLSGQTRQSLEKQKEETIREILIAKELLEQTEQQKRNTLQRVRIINSGIQSRASLIRSMESEISIIDREIEELESQITFIEKDIQKGKNEYAEIIRSTYKHHTDYEKMMYLLASENINQFYQRIKYMRYLTRYREKKVEELQQNIMLLESQKEVLKENKAVKVLLIGQKEDERSTLASERNKRNQVIQQLAQDEQKLKEKLAEQERIRTELEDKIRKAIEEEARKNNENNLFNTLTPEQKLTGRNFNDNRGKLPWPVERGIVTAEFGRINHPVLKGVKIDNNGVDITSSPGTYARSVFDGEVTKIFAILGANYIVLVRHGEFTTVYQNLVDLKVKVGDKVISRQDLGAVYTDPEEKSAVLHFQVWQEKEILDPAVWLSK